MNIPLGAATGAITSAGEVGAAISRSRRNDDSLTFKTGAETVVYIQVARLKITKRKENKQIVTNAEMPDDPMDPNMVFWTPTVGKKSVGLGSVDTYACGLDDNVVGNFIVDILEDASPQGWKFGYSDTEGWDWNGPDEETEDDIDMD